MTRTHLLHRLAAAVLTALLASSLAPAQSVPAVGADSTLDVATWNLTWFGSDSEGPTDDAGQFDHARRVLAEAAVDLWALQEIADPAAFNALLDALGPPYAGRLATTSNTWGSTQRVAFVYDTTVLQPDGAVPFQHILTNKSDAFAGRPPLRFDARFTTADTSFALTFITLHMKAFADAASYDRRVEASRSLKTYLDFLLPNRPVVVLGDFNDQINGSIRSGEPSPYLNFLQDPLDYRILTRSFEATDRVTFCSTSSCTQGSAIDHVLVTDELFPLADAGAVARMAELPSLFPPYRVTTSDHLPVYARLDPPAPTVLPADDEAPVRDVPLLEAYPNPFSSTTTLAFSASAAGPVVVRVFDLLGREVWRWSETRPAGRVRLTLDAADLPPGPYVARLEAGGTAAVRRLVRAR